MGPAMGRAESNASRLTRASRRTKTRAMADPIATLAPRFASALRLAFGDEHAETDAAIRRSEHADFQADVALGLARKLKKKPREVAEDIVRHLDLEGVTASVEIKGPGFVNLVLADGWLSGELGRAAEDERVGVRPEASPETVVVDYGSPNVAKEMHVGHLRSAVIGDALVRHLSFAGHRVVRRNHLGDWGTPFGMLIEQLLDVGANDASHANEGAAVSIRDLDGFYRSARAKFDGDPAFAERARRRVVLLQGGDAETLALWKKLVDASKRYFAEVFARLGVTLTDDDVYGESAYNAALPDVVRALRDKGLLRESEGALCVFPEGFKGKDGDPLPLIVQKQDGGFGYAATDLAALRTRTQDLGATRLLYVIGAPQQQHLAMVFAVATAAGWLVPPARAEHVAFGSVLGPDKKMFKTRAGATVKLIELLDEAVARAAALVKEKNPELDEATRSEVARMVGIGAVKYADLSSDRVKDYVFDWDRMLAFEGNTAPYLQYAHARIQSIVRKAGVDPASVGPIAIREPAEHALGVALLGFESASAAVVDTLQPHRMCTYLFDLATAFSTFYERCPVLRADDEATRASRLALSVLTARVLAKGLGLLGIEAPDRM